MLQQGRKPEALRRLKIAQRLVRGDGVLADDFFPTIKNKIPADTYDRWFDENYSHIQAACEKFPNSHNAHNTAAWLAARAIKNLDEAHAHAKKAVSMRPSQGAYLDTMAEVWFQGGSSKSTHVVEKSDCCQYFSCWRKPPQPADGLCKLPTAEQTIRAFQK